MAASAITPPPGYAVDPSAPPAAPAQPASGITPPPGYSLGETPDPTDPNISGEVWNEGGYKIIVPKDGEEFGDTIKRAIAYHRSLTPEQQQQAMSREIGPTPKDTARKTVETLGGAAAIGFLGPALLAAPGEALMETHAALTAGFKALVPAVTSGVIGVGQWAEAHPVAAKAVLETLKAVAKGVGMYGAAKVAGKVINAHPD